MSMTVQCARKYATTLYFKAGGVGGIVLPYIGYIGMCGVEEYGFLAVLI